MPSFFIYIFIFLPLICPFSLSLQQDIFGQIFESTKSIESDSKININGSLHNHRKGFALTSSFKAFSEINNVYDTKHPHAAQDV